MVIPLSVLKFIHEYRQTEGQYDAIRRLAWISALLRCGFMRSPCCTCQCAFQFEILSQLTDLYETW
jgi:hypothetical protein